MAQVYLDRNFRIVELVSETVLDDLDVVASGFLTVPAALLILDVPRTSSARFITDLIRDIRPEALRRLQSLLEVDHLPFKLRLLRSSRRSVALVKSLLEDKLRGASESHPLPEPGLATEVEDFLCHLETKYFIESLLNTILH